MKDNNTNTVNFQFTQEDIAKFQLFLAMMNNTNATEPKKKTRRKKGQGSVVSLGKGRKRPYMACITTGYDEWTGKQKQTPLAYFKSREEAEKCLDLYFLEKEGMANAGTLQDYIESVDATLPRNSNLRTKAVVKMIPTVREIFEILEKDVFSKNSVQSQKSYASAYKHMVDVYDVKISDLKLVDIENVMSKVKDRGTSKSTQNNVKCLFSAMYKYGMRYDFCEKDYSKFLTLEDTRSKEDIDARKKVPFSKKEIEILRQHDDNATARALLVLIYTGMRPSELLQIAPQNIRLEEGYMVGGLKTKAGKNRIIPIHESIRPYVENVNDLLIGYKTLLEKTKRLADELGLNPKITPHSGRHTFASLSKEYGFDPFLRKRILGHASNDLTDDVYTHVEIEKLVSEIKKLPSRFD